MTRKPNQIPSWRPKSFQPRGSTRRPRVTTVVMLAVRPGSAQLPDSNVTGCRDNPGWRPGGSAPDVAHLDLRKRSRLGGADLGVAVGADAPDRGNRLFQLLVGSVAPDERAKVVALCGEQAREQASFRREACTCAAAAERLR